MFVGVGVISATTYYKYYSEEGCAVDDRMIVAIHLMYSTYLYLFLEFFINRFILKSGQHTAVDKASKKAQ